MMAYVLCGVDNFQPEAVPKFQGEQVPGLRQRKRSSQLLAHSLPVGQSLPASISAMNETTVPRTDSDVW